MKYDYCVNCHNRKSEHSKFDTFCLQLNGWSAEDFESTLQSVNTITLAEDLESVAV